jgi:hypothetical protein
MDQLDELRSEARASSEWLASIVSDISDEQANWRPPGRANTIAATYAHIVRNQDEDMNRGLLRRAMLSEGVWRGKTGCPPSGEWETGAQFDWAALRQYGLAVGGFVVTAVDALTAEDLETIADLSTPDRAIWYGIDVVRLTVGRHVWMHGGEIACLKGLQGAKGYLMGLDTNRP